MTTTQQYLDKYPVTSSSEKLIVGTIHPHDHRSFTIPFFYGNVLSIWNILSDAFPDELTRPVTLKGVLDFLSNRYSSVSDTIRECKRKTPTALDKDLIATRLNLRIIDDIQNSNINHILFTSGFGKNNAFKLFYDDILGYKISTQIKEDREFIDTSTFGRPARLSILYSPSGASNIGISKSKKYLENIH